MTHSVPTAFNAVGMEWVTPGLPRMRSVLLVPISLLLEEQSAFVRKLGRISPDSQLEDFILEMFEKEQKNKYQ